MVRVIAHRGASRAKRENTVDAFVEARRIGADMVELDVRRTADSALAVHHDAVLDDGRRLVDVNVADLPEWVPLLDAALTACAGMEVNVEIKNWPIDPDFDPDDAVAGRVVALLTETGWRGRVIVSSFNIVTVERVRAADQSIATAWLTHASIDPLIAVEQTAAGGHAAIHPHVRSVTPDFITRAHDAGLAVNVWTVDDPETMLQLAEAGVDGIVTNVPDVALGVLGAFRG